jgi:hypothetical protein
MIHGYHWWTVFGWWEDGDRGVKLGPISVCRYRWSAHRWYWYVGVLCWVVWDGVCRPRWRMRKG